jgi:hypothetical protein
MIGKKLYRSATLPILLRELLQNARDACIRAGRPVDIFVTLTRIGSNEIRVRVEDRGCGMSEDDILTKFLCLGGTGKNSATDVGGFGIAKAVIMSTFSWKVWTRDNYIDDTMFEEDTEIVKLHPEFCVDGTVVECEIHDESAWWWGHNMVLGLSTLATNDLPIRLRLVGPGETVDTVLEPLGGMKLIHTHPNLPWTCSLIPAVEVLDHKFPGMNVYRVNGLTQFTNRTSGERLTTLVFDMDLRGIDVTSDDYPLPLSREELKSEWYNDMADLVVTHDQNSITSSKLSTAVVVEDKIQVLDGPRLCGTKMYKSAGDNYQAFQLGNLSIPSISPTHSRVEKLKSTGAVYTEFQHYENDGHLVEDAGILRVWVELLKMVCSDNEYFGIGCTTNSTAIGNRSASNGAVVYWLNVKEFRGSTPKDLKVLQLFQIAAHEACHFVCYSHNETFALMDMQIRLDSMAELLAKMEGLKKLF